MGELDPAFVKEFLSALWSSTTDEVVSLARNVGKEALQRYRHSDKAYSLLHLAVRRARKSSRVDRLRRCAADIIAMEEICRVLIDDLGLDVHCADKAGETALFWACAFGADGLCKFLLQKKADVGALNHHGETALFAASRWSEHHCVNLLLKEKTDPCCRNKCGQTAMTVTGQKTRTLANEPRIKKDLQKEILLTLHKAMKCYPKQADPSEASRVDEFGRNALFYTTSGGATQWLIDRKCSIHSKDASCRTPLHWAAALGPQERIRELLRAKADANAQDVHGQTPLFHALAAEKPVACQSLLDAGCDPFVVDKYGTSVFHEARARVAYSVGRKEYKAAVDVANVITGKCSTAVRMFSLRQRIPSATVRPSDLLPDLYDSPRRLRSVSATPSALLRRDRDRRSQIASKKVVAETKQAKLRKIRTLEKDVEKMQRADRRAKQKQRKSRKEERLDDGGPKSGKIKETAQDKGRHARDSLQASPPIKDEEEKPQILERILKERQAWDGMRVGSLNLTADEAKLLESFLPPKVKLIPEKVGLHSGHKRPRRESPIVDEAFKKDLQDKLDRLDDDHLESIMDFLGNAIDKETSNDMPDGEEEPCIDLDKLPPEKLQSLLDMVDKALAAEDGESEKRTNATRGTDGRSVYTIEFRPDGVSDTLKQGDNGYEIAVRNMFGELRSSHRISAYVDWVKIER